MAYDSPAFGRARHGREAVSHARRVQGAAQRSRSIVPRPATTGNVVDLRPAQAQSCPEIACLRNRLPHWVLAAAERRAAALGIGADRVLVAAGTITEDDYLDALTAFLGIAHEPLHNLPRHACPLDGNRLIEAAAVGLLPLNLGGEMIWVIAPRNLAARMVTGLITSHPELARRIRLTSTASLNRFIALHARAALGSKAADALRLARPHLSAAPRSWRITLAGAIAATVLPGLCFAFPGEAKSALEAFLAAGFLAWLALRLFGSLIEPARPRPARMPDRALPVYTIVVACRAIRPVPAGACGARPAAAARRLVQSFPHVGAARMRRLGPLQRHRGRRSRHPARAVRIPLDRHRLDHL